MKRKKKSSSNGYFHFYLGALLVAAVYLIPARSILELTSADPDRYYHYVVSRLTAETGLVRSLPQVEDVGWGGAFVDKEFLYHVGTSVGYWVAGEAGVLGVNVLFGLMAMLGLYGLGCLGMPPLLSAALTILATTSSNFFERIHMVRPQTLAIGLFIALIIALVHGTYRWVLAVTVLFCLSYHAFVVPLLVFVAFTVASLICKTQWKQKTLAGVLGTVIALFANPYFPQSLVASWEHILVGLGFSPSSGIPHGQESVPFITSAYIFGYAGFLAIGVGATLLLGVLWQKYGRQDRKQIFPMGFAWFGYMGFLVLTMLTPRTWEYAVPFAFVMVALVYPLVPWPRAWACAVAIALVLGSIPNWRDRRNTWRAEKVKKEEGLVAARNALKSLGPESQGKKFFNCNWSNSPYVLYLRPDMRFVDILDPAFLSSGDRERSRAVRSLNSAEFADVFGMLRAAFNADYAICWDGPFVGQMEADPQFFRLYPRKDDPIVPRTFYVYQLAERRAPQFSQTLEIAPFNRRFASPVEPQLSMAKESFPWPETDKKVGKTPMVYVDFVKLSSEQQSAASPARQVASLGNERYACMRSHPSAQEVNRLAKADVVGLGGGEYHRLFRNGSEIFRGRMRLKNNRLVNILIPLDTPVAAGDRFDVITCSDVGAMPFGLSVSFWKGTEIRDICDRKRGADFMLKEPVHSGVSANFSDVECLAPFAKKGSLSPRRPRHRSSRAFGSPTTPGLAFGKLPPS